MEEFSGLLLALYEASRVLPLEQFQDCALALIKRSLYFDSSFWGAAALTDGGISIRSIHLHNLDKSEFAYVYSPSAPQDSAGLTVWHKGGGSYVFHPSMLLPSGKKSKPQTLNWHSKVENMIMASELSGERKLAQWIALFRADRDAQFTKLDLHTMHRLLPHMLEALKINRATQLDRLDIRKSASRDQSAIVDRRGVLNYADSGFMELICKECPKAVGGCMPTEIMKLLLERRHYIGRSTVIHSTRKLGLLFLRAHVRSPIDALSGRQHEITHHIAEGKTYKEIAKTLRISPVTVRNHIAAIHKTLNVRTNTELAALLRAFD